MNEQIKKLAEQAQLTGDEDAINAFAESLIRTCARMASSQAFGAFQAERAILQHFGLKLEITYEAKTTI